jgi:uncharacterized OsmC-like protein
MQTDQIREAIAQIAAHLEANPQDAVSEDKPARAILDHGLKFSIDDLKSWRVSTDMPKALGGEGSAPSPGWLRRAAQAACEATMIAIRAAQEQVELDRLEVQIGSRSDDRGMLGIEDKAMPGPNESWARVTISAKGASEAKLREIVKWAEAHSPVTDALCRAVPHKLHIDIV